MIRYKIQVVCTWWLSLILCGLVVRLIWLSHQNHCWPLRDLLWKGRQVHVVCEPLWYVILLSYTFTQISAICHFFSLCYIWIPWTDDNPLTTVLGTVVLKLCTEGIRSLTVTLFLLLQWSLVLWCVMASDFSTQILKTNLWLLHFLKDCVVTGTVKKKRMSLEKFLYHYYHPLSLRFDSSENLDYIHLGCDDFSCRWLLTFCSFSQQKWWWKLCW